ncbi:GIY-YIG nuclease family protein [Candidatus Sulfidibacterium hydrothermale]|uniref:GIY-YIG nuclease family protein n=1 Tax=Candidatus Sulfidibacterium hydrothermale TaxID=2875962 RepID=UPI001F0B2201|nr:GIY-YIG nuclease family protein [Candidatus Sulfidibacterium hydrothermale]
MFRYKIEDPRKTTKIEDFLFFGISAHHSEQKKKKVQFFTYILISEVDGSLYIGQTQDVEKRLKRHNTGRNRSTSAKRPWKLLYAKPCNSRSEAVKLEKHLKSLKKRKAVFDWIDKQTRGVAQPGPDFAETYVSLQNRGSTKNDENQRFSVFRD